MPLRTIVILAAAAVVLAGCVVVPARPVYYRSAPVVVY